MAIKESQFQRMMRLKAEGKTESEIFTENKKSWTSKTSSFEDRNLTVIGKQMIQDYLDYINYSGPSVVQFFGHIYGHDAIITRLQEESSIGYSYSSDDLSKSSSNFILANGNVVRPNQDLNLIALRANASTSFYDKVIQPTLRNEDKTFQIMSKAFNNINNKDDVINFFNRTGNYATGGKFQTKNKLLPSIRAEQNYVLEQYKTDNIIERKGSKGRPIVRYVLDPIKDENKIKELSNNLKARLEPILDELEKSILDAPQFAFYVKMITGELATFLNNNGIKFDGINPFQMIRSATTAFEILEVVNLMLYLIANKVGSTVESIEVKSTGSELSSAFASFIKTRYGSDQYKFKSKKDLDDALSKFMEQNPEIVVGKSLETLAQKLGSWSGSETSAGTDDFLVEIKFKDNITEQIFIDAKLGQYNRYTGSINTFGGIKGNNITVEKLLSAEKNVGVEEIKKQIEIALTIYLVAILLNKDTKELEPLILNLLKYAFISSTAIQEKFIKDGKQATILFVNNQYTWMSTLFFYMYTTFFNQNNEMDKIGFSFSGINSIKIKSSTQKAFQGINDLNNFMTLIQTNENIQQDVIDLFKALYKIGIKLSITDMFTSYKSGKTYGTLIK